MISRYQQGFSLIELVISIVIIGIAVMGVLLVMNKTTQHSADPMIQHQAVAIAEAYLEEVLTKSYTAQPGTGSRANFDDVDDYLTLPDSVVRDQFGVAIAGLGSYNVTVAVTNEVLSGQTTKRVDVRVVNGTLADITLTGYRTNY